MPFLKPSPGATHATRHRPGGQVFLQAHGRPPGLLPFLLTIRNHRTPGSLREHPTADTNARFPCKILQLQVTITRFTFPETVASKSRKRGPPPKGARGCPKERTSTLPPPPPQSSLGALPKEARKRKALPRDAHGGRGSRRPTAVGGGEGAEGLKGWGRVARQPCKPPCVMCIYTHVRTPRIPSLPCCSCRSLTICCCCCAWTASCSCCLRPRSSASSSAPGTAAESRVCSLPPISGASADAADARLGTRSIHALAARRRGSRASGPSSDRLGSSDALDELTDPDSPGGLRLLRRRSNAPSDDGVSLLSLRLDSPPRKA
ncbi:uncharacterized protein LOC134778674, partial [Penaeus indicus]|uniref:uncharacterized protein LOC134778674 n=1 Tax=Penaeus indicus TaxID=29960 RepID=UPI00300D48B9